LNLEAAVASGVMEAAEGCMRNATRSRACGVGGGVVHPGQCHRCSAIAAGATAGFAMAIDPWVEGVDLLRTASQSGTYALVHTDYARRRRPVPAAFAPAATACGGQHGR